jgi:two-component system response regulator RegA
MPRKPRKPLKRRALSAGGWGLKLHGMPQTPVYLIADDDPDVLKAAAAALAGAVTEAAGDSATVEAMAGARAYDAALLDMNFQLGERSGAEGLALMQRLQAIDPALSVVLMTTWGGVALAVEGLKRGAADFVLKPWRNESLASAMAAAAEQTRLRRASQTALNLDDLERRAIERALQVYGGNVSHAAAALGLTRPALYRRMARHGL